MIAQKFDWAKIVFKIVFDKKFRFWFGQTIRYALNNASDKRGCGASDVLIFWQYIDDILKK